MTIIYIFLSVFIKAVPSIRNFMDHISVSAWRRDFIATFVSDLLLDWNKILATIRIISRPFVLDSNNAFRVN